MAHMCVWGVYMHKFSSVRFFLVARIPDLRGGNSDRVS